MKEAKILAKILADSFASLSVLAQEPTSKSSEPGAYCWLKLAVRTLTGRIRLSWKEISLSCNLTGDCQIGLPVGVISAALVGSHHQHELGELAARGLRDGLGHAAVGRLNGVPVHI